MSDLKPCPFCGGKARRVYEPEVIEEYTGKKWAYTVSCERCAASTGLCYTREQADEAWNRRATIEPELIRCGECKHSEHWYRDKARCFLWHEEGIDVFEDGYCSYAERR